MTPQEFEVRILSWARQQPDIEALVQFGSRVLSEGEFDAFSDWDFHLITNCPQKYYLSGWISEIAPVWCNYIERSLRGSMKATAIFEGGLEADFVLLKAWQMRLVYFGMKFPELAKWMPIQLRNGISETRVIMLGSGFRVLIGGRKWEKRLSALDIPWTPRRMSPEDFNRHTAAFCKKSVWIAKKIARPESRSAMHWMHKLVIEHLYALLEEEAWLAGRVARPEALKAEKWLDAKRLAQTQIETSTDQRVLARALLAQIALFEEVCTSVAGSRGWPVPDYSAVASWLRQELTKLTERT